MEIPTGIYVAFDLSITCCTTEPEQEREPGVWEATSSISVVTLELFFSLCFTFVTLRSQYLVL